MSNLNNPLIVQSDLSILLEVHNEKAEEVRTRLSSFAELVKSPEHIHTFKLTPLSIWNAQATGTGSKEILKSLSDYSKYPVPSVVIQKIEDITSRFGKTKLVKNGKQLKVQIKDVATYELLRCDKEVSPFLIKNGEELSFQVDIGNRGLLKRALVKAGYPADDCAGYLEGEKFTIKLKQSLASGAPFVLRDYQLQAADAFYQEGRVSGGSGVICLPCGAGKTIVGIAAMTKISQKTLILTTNVTSVKQWRREILEKTLINPEYISEYISENKRTAPITIATYQMLTWRPSKDDAFKNLGIFQEEKWGLIIYDEVHLLPAPVFRATAEIQARRRLGLTATLVREDGREDDVFALIGPKRYDMPWRQLEESGWIAKARCTEIRVPVPEAIKMKYALAPKRMKFRIASENPKKSVIIKLILQEFNSGKILIIGDYIDQLQNISNQLKIPLVTGKTTQKMREELYTKFKKGEISRLVLSKVGNFALDLPGADVMIQISGTFGSRQEEAQRLGRILRPKPGSNQAHFFTLVSEDTCEEDFAHNRQLFLTEQGYSYQLIYSRTFKDRPKEQIGDLING